MSKLLTSHESNKALIDGSIKIPLQATIDTKSLESRDWLPLLKRGLNLFYNLDGHLIIIKIVMRIAIYLQPIISIIAKSILN